MWQASRVRPARALARIPARASLASASGVAAGTIALSPGGRPRPEPVGQPDVVLVDDRDSDLLDDLQGRGRADPGHPGRRGVEAPGAGGQVHGWPVVTAGPVGP